MVNLYISNYGSNDLCHYSNESCKSLLENINRFNNINIFACYSFKDIDRERVWLNYPKTLKAEVQEVTFQWFNCNLVYKDINKYYSTLERKFQFIDIVKFLKDSGIQRNEGNNVVLISGHGGLFQSLLDMSGKEMYAINTVFLCNMLRELPIDLLLLDMCAMNYIEIVYEILKDSKIKNLILFKGLAPLQGIDILKVTDIFLKEAPMEMYIKELLSLKEYPLIYIGDNEVKNIESFKNKLSKYYITSEINESNALEIVNILKNVAQEGAGCTNDTGFPLLFISNELRENKEKEYYKQYRFAQNNFWSKRVTAGVEEIDKVDKIILLTQENLKHIINLHNPKLSIEMINSLYKKYSKVKS